MADRGPRPGLRSVRARTTAGATAVVAVALVVGSVAFHGVLASALRSASESAAEARIEELAARVESDGDGVVDRLDDDLVQLIASNGAIVAASEEASDSALPVHEEPRRQRYDGEPVVVLSEDLDDDRTLVLAVSEEDDVETLGTVDVLLAVAVPVVTALVAVITWFVVGRALRPVRRIRTQVDAITSTRLDRRVEQPDSGDEIAALAATMNRMLDRLDSAAGAQRRFVSDASHELRSPLAAIRQHAELARSHPGATSVGELAETVHAEGIRLQALIDALLVLARIDERAPSALEPVDLDDLALAETERMRGGRLSVDGSGIGAARALGDPRLLAQMARNLADNAARHATGRIAVSTSVADGRALFVVEDDGGGIPPAERERVFDRFVRLDEARARDDGGSGLGLAIVRGAAESAGGVVRIDDSPLGGARIEVALPVAPESA